MTRTPASVPPAPLPPDMNAAAKWFREKGIAAREIAHAVDAGPRAVRAWLAGDYTPSDEHAARINLKYPVTRAMWRMRADGTRKEQSRAARSLERRKTRGSAPLSPLEQLQEGALLPKEAKALVAMVLRDQQARAELAIGELAEADRVFGHIAFREMRVAVLRVVDLEQRLRKPIRAAIPEETPGGPLAKLRDVRAALKQLREVLTKSAADAMLEQRLGLANEYEGFAGRLDKLAARASLSDVKLDALLKSDAWAEVTIAVCAVLRGHGELLECLVEELGAAPDPFTRALVAALRDVRHITWPAHQFQKDVLGFFRLVLGVVLYDKQEEIALAVQNGTKVSVRSGHRVGKSLLLAGLALWFYACFPEARVFITAPTDRQLDEIDWREIRMRVVQGGVCVACKMANRDLEPMFQVRAPCPHSAKIDGILKEKARGGMHSGDFRQITGFTARDTESATGLAGRNLLFLVEEASGVAKFIFTGLIGNLAGGGRLVLFGNPSVNEGEHYDAHYPPKLAAGDEAPEPYVCFTLSSWETPNARNGWTTADAEYVHGLATRQWCEDRKRAWGPDSEEYSVRVLGLHFLGSAHRMFPVKLLIESEQRWESESENDSEGVLCVGGDPRGEAGTGDPLGLAVCRGDRMLEVDAVGGELDALGQFSEMLARGLKWKRGREVIVLVIDVEGVGLDVYREACMYAEHNPALVRVIGVKSSNASQYEPHIYHLQRDGLAGHFRDWMRQGGALPPDLKLSAELAALEGRMMPKPGGMRFKLIDKLQLKKKLKRSTDRYDACALAAWGQRAEQYQYTPQSEKTAAEEEGTERPALDPYSGAINPYDR